MSTSTDVRGSARRFTVKAHSSGPDVERGRCPNLGCIVCLEAADILRVQGDGDERIVGFDL